MSRPKQVLPQPLAAILLTVGVRRPRMAFLEQPVLLELLKFHRRARAQMHVWPPSGPALLQL